MTSDQLHLARFTIEALSPLSIGGGEFGSFDMSLARDMNGLPTIPGASIRGVLRKQHKLSTSKEEDTNKLFGIEDDGETKGRAGQITFGFGCVHDKENTAIFGLADRKKMESDQVHLFLRREAPLMRHHVALNDRHVADDTGKFERIAVPVGTRFSFELAMWGAQDAAKAAFRTIRALLKDEGLRIGGGATRGYGRIALKKFGACFDVDSDTVENIRRSPPSDHRCFEEIDPDHSTSESSRASKTYRMRLKPVGFIRVGSTGRPSVPDRTNPPDASPTREKLITWREGSASIDDKEDRYIIPAAGIVGPLAHRTLYHYNKLKGHWADCSSDERASISRRPTELEDLFGSAKGNVAADQSSRLIADDAVIRGGEIIEVHHNSIDRFSGGARNGVLFSEAVLFGDNIEIKLSLTLLPPLKGDWSAKAHVLDAFHAAIRDLCEGRLALGAKSMGFVIGDVPEKARATVKADMHG